MEMLLFIFLFLCPYYLFYNNGLLLQMLKVQYVIFLGALFLKMSFKKKKILFLLVKCFYSDGGVLGEVGGSGLVSWKWRNVINPGSLLSSGDCPPPPTAAPSPQPGGINAHPDSPKPATVSFNVAA